MYRSFRRRSKLKRLIILLSLTAVFIFVIMIYVNIKLAPLIKPIAIANAKSIATRSINEAVNDEILKMNVKYDDLIAFDKDNNNRITILRANTVAINEIQAKLSVAVLNKINKLNDAEVKIPIGNLIDSNLFSNRGPKITLKLIPVGYATSAIKSKFETAGINQTRHEINLCVKATIGVIMTTSTEYSEVSVEIPITESVIVGEVPDTYTDINGDTGDMLDKFNNYANK